MSELRSRSAEKGFVSFNECVFSWKQNVSCLLVRKWRQDSVVNRLFSDVSPFLSVCRLTLCLNACSGTSGWTVSFSCYLTGMSSVCVGDWLCVWVWVYV
jgi:hypothetical protein